MQIPFWNYETANTEIQCGDASFPIDRIWNHYSQGSGAKEGRRQEGRLDNLDNCIARN